MMGSFRLSRAFSSDETGMSGIFQVRLRLRKKKFLVSSVKSRTMARRDEKGVTNMHAILPEGLAEDLVHAAASGRLPEGPRRAQLPEKPGQASV